MIFLRAISLISFLASSYVVNYGTGGTSGVADTYDRFQVENIQPYFQLDLELGSEDDQNHDIPYYLTWNRRYTLDDKNHEVYDFCTFSLQYRTGHNTSATIDFHTPSL